MQAKFSGRFPSSVSSRSPKLLSACPRENPSTFWNHLIISLLSHSSAPTFHFVVPVFWQRFAVSCFPFQVQRYTDNHFYHTLRKCHRYWDSSQISSWICFKVPHKLSSAPELFFTSELFPLWSQSNLVQCKSVTFWLLKANLRYFHFLASSFGFPSLFWRSINWPKTLLFTDYSSISHSHS